MEAAPLAGFNGGAYLPDGVVKTDEAIEKHIRERSDHIYHPVGTCRMGLDDDAVVDGDLRLRGLSNVRVIDASVMPTITRGNTHKRRTNDRHGWAN